MDCGGRCFLSRFAAGDDGVADKSSKFVGEFCGFSLSGKMRAPDKRSLETYPKRRQSVDSMKNKRRMRLRSLLAAAFAAQISAEPVILYDGDLRSLPEDQGWIYRLEPPIRNQSRQVLVEGAINLNTSRNLADRAGYFVRFPQMEPHPQAPEMLDHRQGYRIGFTLRLYSERRAAPNQAGFSLIVLSQDLLGIELGFGAGEVFARSAAFGRAEENRALPFRIDKQYADFALDMRESEYRLSVNEQEILAGSLRNYSDAGEPHTVPNLLFFGDNAESAGASVNLRRFWVDTEPSVSQPGEPKPMPPIEPEPPIAGDSAVFSVIEEESVLSLSGTALGIAIKAQGEGSLSAAYSGTLRLLLTDDRIQFQPASQIDAQPSGEWEPKFGGKSGSAPADYGGIVPGNALVGNTLAVAAARNVKFTLASDWIELSEPNEERMEFSASSLLFAIPADFGSVLDTATLGLLPIRTATPIDGISGLNRPETLAALAVQGNVQTLTLPVLAEVSGRIISDDDLKLTFSGQIIAHRNLLAEPPQLAIRRLPTGEVQLSWNAVLGDDYLVEQSADLRQWETAVLADGKGNLIRADKETVVCPVPTEKTARYYRVIRNPLPR